MITNGFKKADFNLSIYGTNFHHASKKNIIDNTFIYLRILSLRSRKNSFLHLIFIHICRYSCIKWIHCKCIFIEIITFQVTFWSQMKWNTTWIKYIHWTWNFLYRIDWTAMKCIYIELETWNEFIRNILVEASSISSSIRNLDVKLDSDSQVHVSFDPIPIWRS